MNKKIILAYSGGLDTTYAIEYLKKTYQSDVIALLIDLGEEKNTRALEKRAIQAGASKCYIINGQEDLANDFISKAIQANTLYEGVYPLVSALSRPLIARYLVETAKKEKAFAVAHGCTAKGNDQVRFDLGIRSLDPNLQVIAPMREHPVNRNEAIEHVLSRGIDIPISNKSPYSIDMNIWGRSCECGILEDPWIEPPQDAYALTTNPELALDKAEYIEIDFALGLPIALNGKKLSLRDLVVTLNSIVGKHGIGRIDHLENRVVGIKSREIYEAPAALTLIQAHRAIEGMCLNSELAHYKEGVDVEIARLIYRGMWYSPLFESLLAFVKESQKEVSGTIRLKLFKGQATVVGRKSKNSLYDFALSTYNPEDLFDHKSAEGFIKIFGLPLEVYAKKKLKK